MNERLELWPTVGHVAYLSLFVVVGWLSARRSFAKRLGK